ncbi:MAG: hypothetical protein N2449_06695 [Bacteroidales bacterium]|nr:hypothetical protein [Bacteroidales bacterium]
MGNYKQLYERCVLCPHECGVNRIEGELGICRATHRQHIASICIHRGEEPIISGKKGICNVFFSHCNLRCLYCQNHQISSYVSPIETITDTLSVVKQIIRILDTGINILGFVSPSHMVVQTIEIIEELWNNGYHPYTVWNSNAYDKPETIKMLEPYINIYLPDFKYADETLATIYSNAPYYPQIALNAIKEMYYQKGNTLIINEEEGIAESGLIIRHLVLPNHIDNSIKVLETIANEISTGVALSLMSQYYPPDALCLPHNLQRKLKANEYEMVVNKMNELGFNKGWVQEYESYEFYRPDFNKHHPFE